MAQKEVKNFLSTLTGNGQLTFVNILKVCRLVMRFKFLLTNLVDLTFKPQLPPLH